ncbi:podoplanin isoform X1 [Phacochoerus africanus]|uniref:podoplanin isoform X1 n=2 Tax=Phacochoerus africanus TaxID=41426 RepID=UPI001FD8E74A|nr:podoplanin isoform X1 [Phacochoerus africanus]
MWKVPVLFFVLGSASLWVLAEGASTVLPEDGVTPGVEGSSKASPGVEDYTVTPRTREEPHATPLVPTRTKGTTGSPTEDVFTVGSTTHSHKGSQSTTTQNVVTSQSHDKGDEEKSKTVTKDGLGTVTLVGITVGVLLAIGFIGGIIVVLVRKMSGRYSP